MITYEEARAAAAAQIREGEPRESGAVWVIIDSSTVEREWGWVFAYNTKQCLEGDPKYTLLGNVPIAVERSDGSVHATGLGRNMDECIAAYEVRRARRLAGLPEMPPRAPLLRIADWMVGPWVRWSEWRGKR